LIHHLAHNKKMKRWLIGLVIGVLLMVFTRPQAAAAEPPSAWHPDVMEELTMDEWPVEVDAMDEDERLYELEALEAERREEQQQLSNSSNGQPDFEEEDDVDQDDMEDEEEEEDNDNEGTVYFDDVQSPEKDGSLDGLILPPPPPPPPVAPNPKPKPTTKLQQQEEQDLEVLDQSIVDTLQAALDVMKQDRPSRYIPPTNATTSTITNPDTSSSPSLFMAALHYLMYWASYGSIGILLIMVILIIFRRYKVNQDKGVCCVH
jgi:hypothetical protein